MQGVEPVALPSPQDVAADVRLVVGRARSPVGLAELDLPALDRLVGADRSRLGDLLLVSILRIENEQYREFLSLLLPFPFTPAAPWEQLGPNRRTDGRGERAARAAFGLSWDACNRPGQLLDGRSRRDWAEHFLAAELLAASATDPAAQDESPLDDAQKDESSLETSQMGTSEMETVAAGHARRGPVAAVLAGMAAVVVAVTVGAVTLALGGGTGDDRTPSGGSAATAAVEVSGRSIERDELISCASIGALDTNSSELARSTEISQRLADHQPNLPAGVGCPIGPAFVWDQLVVQEFDSGEDGLPAAVLVEIGSGTTVDLSPTAYARYRTLGANDGSMAQDLGGFPSSFVTLPDGSQQVELSKGVLFVAQTDGAPFFWIPAEFVPLWRSSPQLGRPTGNPLPSLVQDYEFGFGHLRQTDELPVIEVLADPGAELPPPGQLLEKVLRQRDGTAWWVGGDGQRYWIASAEVWNCRVAGRDDEVQSVRGYAIATLPYGGHAECPKS